MNELLARNWGLLVFRGVIGILFGALAMIWPGLTVLALVILWGAYAIVDGIAAVVMGFAGRGADRWVSVVTGVLGLLAGAIAFVWPGMTAFVLLVFIGVWSIAVGVMCLIAAWRIRQEITGEWLLALTGVAFIALGILLFLQPEAGALGLVSFIGILAVVWGAVTVVLGLRMRSLAKHPPTGTVRTTRTVQEVSAVDRPSRESS